MRPVILSIVLLLAGCATQQAATPVAEPAPVVTDNFCETARKRSWSVKDTAQSIAEARTWNRAIDRRCGVSGG